MGFLSSCPLHVKITLMHKFFFGTRSCKQNFNLPWPDFNKYINLSNQGAPSIVWSSSKRLDYGLLSPFAEVSYLNSVSEDAHSVILLE
jgi:hypothetical protein